MATQLVMTRAEQKAALAALDLATEAVKSARVTGPVASGGWVGPTGRLSKVELEELPFTEDDVLRVASQVEAAIKTKTRQDEFGKRTAQVLRALSPLITALV